MAVCQTSGYASRRTDDILHALIPDKLLPATHVAISFQRGAGAGPRVVGVGGGEDGVAKVVFVCFCEEKLGQVFPPTDPPNVSITVNVNS